MSSDVVFDDKGQVTAITIEWTFDDGYAQMALDGLDTDGDGVYSATELEALTRENMDSLKDYDYFLHVFAGRKAVAHSSRPRIRVRFTAITASSSISPCPLETPLDPKKNDFYYRIYDPEFFIAMDYIKDEPVTAQGPIPADCKLDLRPIVTDAQHRGDAPDARHQGPRLAAAAE